MSVVLFVNTNTMQIKKSGKITGDIYLKIDGVSLPDVNWNDFSVVIMSWLIGAINNLINGSIQKEVVNFMDGPYFVEIDKTHKDFIFTFLCGHSEKNILANGHEAVKKFLDNVISSAEETLVVCDKNDWMNRDIEHLRQNLFLLKKALNLHVS